MALPTDDPVNTGILGYPTEIDSRKPTKKLSKHDDLITIKKVINGWIVIVSPNEYGQSAEELVFNSFDYMCETLRKLYEDSLEDEN